MSNKILVVILLFCFFSNVSVFSQDASADSLESVTLLVGIIDENMLDDEMESGAQEISSMMIMSSDAYLKAVGFRLSPFYFRVRGYKSNYEAKYINGVNLNDQYRGVFNYASIGALNDYTRNGDVEHYTLPGAFNYGSIGGVENMNFMAGSVAKGLKVTVSAANRNYLFRGMASFSTGMSPKGWAFTYGMGARYSTEGSIEGTFYRNISYLLGVEREWAQGRHSLSLVTFGSPVERGQQGASFQEVYDLTGNNLYNPNWGFQNGKKRNARTVKAYAPTAILSHIWKINRDLVLRSGLGVYFSMYGVTGLNWFNGPDPRPDYYRYLPSYHAQNEIAFERYAELWKNNDPATVQIDWDNLYRINALAKQSGSGDAIYMVENRRSDMLEATFYSTLRAKKNEMGDITAGVEIRASQSMQYKKVEDLLGADYILDIDKFSERDFQGNFDVIQNDLNSVNRKARKGDIFGYNFDVNINSAKIWFINRHHIGNLDYYYGMNIKYTEFQRNGLMKNGRFPDNSYGKGVKHTFADCAAKAGLVYKITGRQFAAANVSVASEAPLPDKAYSSVRITDHTFGQLKSGKIYTADVNYIFSFKSLSGRCSLFHSEFFNQMDRVSYYHDAAGTFVNHILSGINRKNRGVELAAKYRIDGNWSLDVAGTLAEYTYSNNPNGTLNYENGAAEDQKETVYLKNYRLGGTPQSAGTFAVNYFNNFWFISLHFNYVGDNYIDIAPLRRLASNYSTLPDRQGINPHNEEDMKIYYSLTHQEKFKNAMTVDFSLGKILYLKNRKSFNFNLAINNILNKKDVRTGGYEAGRIDLSYPDRFRSKYYYMQGVNFYMNASYKF